MGNDALKANPMQNTVTTNNHVSHSNMVLGLNSGIACIPQRPSLHCGTVSDMGADHHRRLRLLLCDMRCYGLQYVRLHGAVVQENPVAKNFSLPDGFHHPCRLNCLLLHGKQPRMDCYPGRI